MDAILGLVIFIFVLHLIGPLVYWIGEGINCDFLFEPRRRARAEEYEELAARYKPLDPNKWPCKKKSPKPSMEELNRIAAEKWKKEHPNHCYSKKHKERERRKLANQRTNGNKTEPQKCLAAAGTSGKNVHKHRKQNGGKQRPAVSSKKGKRP